jgi:ribosomal protein L11 methyltransferase
MNWLEVSLFVSGELAEAVAEVLARFAPSGVVTERGVRFADPEDEGTPLEAVTVRAYLPADEHLDETRHKLEEALFYLGMIQPLPAPIYTPIPDQNWMEAWKEHYQPIPVGRRLIIVPAWLDSPDPGRIPIKIDPGMAFGTGTHPTTQLCLELLENFVERGARSVERMTWGDERQLPIVNRNSPIANRVSSLVTRHASLIDVGCGSGILSIAALKLGADFALGVDIDEAAVQASRANAQVNGIAAEQFALGVGSVREVLDGKFAIRSAPLVLANILAPVIIRLFGDGLADLVAPGGRLILSGILEEQVETVLSAARAHGMELAAKKQIEDWVAFACKPANL